MSASIRTTETLIDSSNHSEHDGDRDNTTVNSQERERPSPDHSVPLENYSADEGAELNFEPVQRIQSQPHRPERVTSFVSQRSQPLTFRAEQNAGIAHRGIVQSSTWNSQRSHTSLDENWAPQHILCLDGGGVRGYSALLIMRRLMKIIERIERAHPQPAKSSFDTHEIASHPSIADDLWASERERLKHEGKFLPCHYFDYCFGTSTGGLIAILLGRLRMSVDEALEKYDNLAGEIFGHPRTWSIRGPLPWWQPKHSSKRFESILKKVINEKEGREGGQQVRSGVFSRDPTFNSEPLMCRTVCVAYCDAGPALRTPTLFRSYEHIATGKVWERNPGPAHAIPIWKIARATSAAPTYFKRMSIDGAEFVDGAFGTNNPALEAYYEVRNMHNGNDNFIGLFLSVGTGEVKPSEMPGRGLAQWKYYFTALLSHGLDPQLADTHVQQLADGKFPYSRFNVNDIKAKVKLDDWESTRGAKPSTKDLITELTDDYLDQEPTDTELKEVAQLLVKSRRKRAATPRWYLAMGLRFRCTVDKCHNGQKIRNTREDLVSHIDRMHAGLTAKEKEAHIEKGTLRR